MAKNFNERFTAWTSRGGNSAAGSLPVTKHAFFSFLCFTKIQNKIGAAAARIGITCGKTDEARDLLNLRSDLTVDVLQRDRVNACQLYLLEGY